MTAFQRYIVLHRNRLIRIIAMRRFALPFIVALSGLLPLTAAQADSNQIRGGIQSLSPKGMLTIGGITGSSRSNPGSRNCYGSTRCRESGSFYTEDGILNYKNGDPLVQRNSTRKIGSLPESNSGNIVRHNQWCGSQYRSFRRSDNSYQPFSGSRQSCNSPYQ